MELKPFNTIYDLEAKEFEDQKKEGSSIFFLLLKASGIFVTITMIVFGIANYQFIKNQIIDWKRGPRDEEEFAGDSDDDGIPDWWEKRYGLQLEVDDASDDSDNDFASNFTEYRFGIDPKNPDTDGDGYFDGEEIILGFNPNGIGRIDSDKDGMYDWWEELHGFDKKDPSDASLDPDSDGLTNLEESKYFSDPTNPDTDGDGVRDGAEVKKGLNPSGEGTLQDLLDSVSKKDDEDGDDLELAFENFFGTDPTNPDTDGDGYEDYREVSRGYDPTGGGWIKAEIEIPGLDVRAPIVWSEAEEEAEVQKDLENGVVHMTRTAIPGMPGNSYITGHSSYYTWSKSQYKEVFRDLGQLKAGDEVIFHYEFQNGKTVDVVYKVETSEVVLPDDERLFRDFEGSELTLVTCWPVGTDWKRLMIKAKLERPQL